MSFWLCLGLATSALLGSNGRQERLGAQLFADSRLSVDGSVACASCHVPERGFVDNLPASRGVGGRTGVRNAPTLLNAALQGAFFWDGHAASLEEQAMGPLLNPKEMGLPDAAALVQRVAPEYHSELTALFGSSWGAAEVVQCITAYERTLTAVNSPVDAFLRGDTAALSPAARQGWELFNGRGRCNLCHALDKATQLFSDGGYHNIGIGAVPEGVYVPLAQRIGDLGRFSITGNPAHRAAFRTSDLRNVVLTAPYMHDGSLATLWDVMDHYNRGGDLNPRLDSEMRPLGLSEGEIDSLVEFMVALTDARFADVARQAYAAQVARKDVRPERR